MDWTSDMVRRAFVFQNLSEIPKAFKEGESIKLNSEFLGFLSFFLKIHWNYSSYVRHLVYSDSERQKAGWWDPGLGGRRNRDLSLMDVEFHFGRMKSSSWWWFYNNVNVLNAAEHSTLQNGCSGKFIFIYKYIYYIYVFYNNKKEKPLKSWSC